MHGWPVLLVVELLSAPCHLAIWGSSRFPLDAPMTGQALQEGSQLIRPPIRSSGGSWPPRGHPAWELPRNSRYGRRHSGQFPDLHANVTSQPAYPGARPVPWLLQYRVVGCAAFALLMRRRRGTRSAPPPRNHPHHTAGFQLDGVVSLRSGLTPHSFV